MSKDLTTTKVVGTNSHLLNKAGTPAAAAHNYLLDAADVMHLSAEPQISAISAIKLYDRRRRYLFSWIINAHHLLFYIRKPAINLMPALVSGAQQHLQNVRVNPAGEITVRIETAADAQALTEWLFSPATWAQGKASPRIAVGQTRLGTDKADQAGLVKLPQD